MDDDGPTIGPQSDNRQARNDIAHKVAAFLGGPDKIKEILRHAREQGCCAVIKVGDIGLTADDVLKRGMSPGHFILYSAGGINYYPPQDCLISIEAVAKVLKLSTAERQI